MPYTYSNLLNAPAGNNADTARAHMSSSPTSPSAPALPLLADPDQKQPQCYQGEVVARERSLELRALHGGRHGPDRLPTRSPGNDAGWAHHVVRRLGPDDRRDITLALEMSDGATDTAHLKIAPADVGEQTNMRRAAGHILSMMDSDLSGTLDEKELSVALKKLSPDAKTRGSLPQEARLLAERYGTRNRSTDGSGEVYEVDSKGFPNALSDVTGGDIEDVTENTTQHGSELEHTRRKYAPRPSEHKGSKRTSGRHRGGHTRLAYCSTCRPRRGRPTSRQFWVLASGLRMTLLLVFAAGISAQTFCVLPPGSCAGKKHAFKRREGGLNPFDGVASVGYPVPPLCGCDDDGDMDLVIGR